MNNGDLRQSTASQTRLIGPFLDDTDFKTAETALSIANTDVRLSKNGAAYGNKNSGGGTHLEGGCYAVTFDATDTNTLGELQVKIVKSGALIVVHKFNVLTAEEYDRKYDTVVAAGAARAAYCGAVWCDEAAAGTGTTVGTHGTPNNPVNSLADAITLAGSAKTGLRRVNLCGVTAGAIALSSAVGDIEIAATQGTKMITPSTSPVMTLTRFVNVDINGAFGGGSDVSLKECVLTALSGAGAVAERCRIDQITIPSSNVFVGHQCFTRSDSGYPQVNLAANSSVLSLTQFSGQLSLANMDATNSVYIDGTGKIIIENTCLGGEVVLRGSFEVVDNSAGAVTINYTATGVDITQIAGDSTRAEALGRAMDIIEPFVVTGASSETEIVAGGLASTVDGTYKDRTVVWDKATMTAGLRGRMTVCSHSLGSPKKLIVDHMAYAPQIGDRGVLQ